ncbi:hypothetical protein RclHR1_00150032 [Rhizophagus clarus]|uniref:Uncharacterized protein n=1 Tax=Rhizophagus clarus TaxID=94130 RepID=A0A2Z6R6M2_9GLOM|nr:hypothetical protein RclHR1_00150032 [Rhizophagus clarus]GET02315.1 hypothetical protein GLOIN_2v1525677 [Rhizophagus clarus]
MGNDLSKYFLINNSNSKLDKDKRNSQKITTIAPNYNSGEIDSTLNTQTLIPKLLKESEEKLKNKDYENYLTILQRTSNLGSGLAAAKLGNIYLHGLQGTKVITPNYETSAHYYFLSLKIIILIDDTLWDMNLLLDVIINITELYRFQFDKEIDNRLWDEGLTLLKRYDSIMNEAQFIKFQTHENNQIRKAIRVHILFILAFTCELDCNYIEAMNIYQKCEKIEMTNISNADKLIKKSHTNYRLLQDKLEKGIPNVSPICVECNFEPKDTEEIWKLLVCSKCQNVACCSRQCLQHHIANEHAQVIS